MKKIDLQPDREKYYSQLNNELDPYIACQVTTMVMGLDIGGFGLAPIEKIEGCVFSQPEDRLRWYMLNDLAVQEFWRKNFDASTPAPEWAGCMVFAINRLYGRDIVRFDGTITQEEIRQDLTHGLPLYISMAFPDNKNFSGRLSPLSGHIVLIVGLEEDGSILINDPYKNHLTGDRDGYKNVYTPEEYAKHAKGYAIRYNQLSVG